MINYVYIKDNKVALVTTSPLANHADDKAAGVDQDHDKYDSVQTWDDEDKYVSVELKDGALSGLTGADIMQKVNAGEL